jgi:tetratricopeptide (TPR) repeat protein
LFGEDVVTMRPRQLLVASVSAVLLAAYAAAPTASAAPIPAPQTVTFEAATAYLSQASKDQRNGDYPAAIRNYGEALKGPLSEKMRVAAVYNRALAYHQSGNPTLAIHDYSAALLLDPELAHAYYGRANAMRELGQYASALADYQKAAYYKYPHAHLPRFGQALTYEMLNRPLSAEKLLQETLQIAPDFEPARKKLAELQGLAQRVKKDSTEAPARIAVAVNANSVYGSMTDRIDSIVTSSVPTVAPDQVVRKMSYPAAVRPPSHLLDAAEQVEVATVKLSGQASISVAETPASISPAFLVSEKTRVQKIQDRVPAEEGSEPSVAQADLKIEPVAAPVEYKTRAMDEARDAAALTPPVVEAAPAVEGFLIQINSQRSEAAAWAAWKRLKEKHAKLLADREVIVQKADLGEQGTVYRLRIKNLSTKAEAASICEKLRAAGLSCFVAKAGA